MSDYLKKAVSGASITFVLSIVAAFITYLIRLVFARNLSVEDFGLFFAISAFVGMFTALKTLGLNQALAKFIPEFQVRKQWGQLKRIVWYSLIFQLLGSGLVAITIILLAPIIVTKYFGVPDATPLLIILTIAFVLQSFDSTLMGSFRGFQKMTLRAMVDVCKALFVLSIAIILFKLDYGVLGGAIAYMITPLLLLILFTKPLLQHLRPARTKHISFRKTEILTMFAFSLPVLLSSVGNQIIQYTDTLILAKVSTLHATGLYNVALPTSALLSYIGVAFTTVLMPLVAELWSKNLRDTLSQAIILSYKYSLYLLAPMVVVMILFAKTIINLMFGAAFVDAATALQILSFGALFLTLASVNTVVLVGIGKPKVTSVIVLIGAGINVVLNLLLIPQYDLVGAGIASVISFIAMFIIGTIVLRRHVATLFPTTDVLKIFFSGTLMAAACWGLVQALHLHQLVELVMVSLLGTMLYLLLTMMLGTVQMKEIRMILKSMRS